MFCDMVDSTGHQFRMKPEQFAAILRGYQEIVFDCVRRRGGYVARVVGDGILVLFGWPSATGRDAQTAVLCALDIAARISQSPVAARLAIETGWVLVGDIAAANVPIGGIEPAAVVGSAANVAARLQQIAHPNGVVVGEGTLPLLGDRFITNPADTTGLKLPFEVAAAHVLADAGAGDPLGWLKRRFARGGAMLVGREALFRDIEARWHQARDGAGQAVLLTGGPGIGKSHLLAALLNAVTDDRPEIVSLFCAPTSRDSSLQPVLQWLRLAIGLEAGALPEEIRTQTTQYAEGLGLDAAASGSLAALLGATPEDARAPERVRRQIFDVLTDLFARIATNRSLLILVEDLHWADPSTAELVGQLITAAPNRRMMLVGTDRTPSGDAFPRLAHVSHWPLAPLNADTSLEMVRGIAKRFGVDLDADAQIAIADRAEGVALFIEEFVRSIADNRDSLDRPPGTIGQLLAARLDGLGTAKPLAQLASVFGREAPLDLLAELSGLPPAAFEAEVDRLTSSDVMVRRGTGDKAELVFRHALLADAAYGVMQQAHKRLLHRQVARALRRAHPSLAEIAPEVLGRHLAEAGETAEAAPLFRAAAQAMLETGAYAEAEAHARRALALSESMTDTAAILASLLPLGEALIAGRGYADPEVQKVYERGARLALELGTARELLPALRGLTSYYQVRGPMTRARELGEQVLRIARIVGDPVMICVAEQRHGWCLMCQGKLVSAEATMESALARHLELEADQRDKDREDASILAHLAWLDWLIRGRDAMLRRAASAASRVSEARPLKASYVLGFVAVAQQLAGSPEETARFAEQSGAIAREHGLVYWIAMADALIGWSKAVRLDPDGLGLLHKALTDYDRTQGQVLLPYLLGLLAEAELLVGDRAAALAALNRADAVRLAIGSDLYRAPLLRLRARLLDGQARNNALLEAKHIAEEQGAAAFALLIETEIGLGSPPSDVRA